MTFLMLSDRWIKPYSGMWGAESSMWESLLPPTVCGGLARCFWTCRQAKAFLLAQGFLQGGDCAESFAEHSAPTTSATPSACFLQMAVVLTFAAACRW
jgi:3-deoxy-D-arabino-heptulosonate 7-phosphate (DAHP) synthase class II